MSNTKGLFLSFAEASAHAEDLNAEVAVTGDVLRAFPKNSTGLTPDSVRATAEYVTAKRAFDVAFKALQDFNSFFTKKFAKELIAARDARRLARSKGTV